MQKVAEVWRNLFDIRPGEYRRTIFMSLYLLFVLFAYYVLKSASEAMFLNKFDIDKLPNLYILMAIPQRYNHDLCFRGLGPAFQCRHGNAGLGGREQSLHLTRS